MYKPAYSQISSFVLMLKNTPEHFGIYNLDNAFSILEEKMSLKQYKYLLHLIFSKKYFKAKQILDQIGLEHKQAN